MPQFLIEEPMGIRHDAKQKMMQEITAAIDEAYHIRQHDGRHRYGALSHRANLRSARQPMGRRPP
jgi:hypothetical protein